MQLESKKHLEDMRRSANAIVGFVEGKSFEDYVGDRLLRSGVERQFEVMGEALNRLSKSDPDTAEQISHRRQIISFRNILIHGYDIVDDTVVWDVVQQRLAVLLDEVNRLLSE